jgi:hypothetical protein
MKDMTTTLYVGRGATMRFTPDDGGIFFAAATVDSAIESWSRRFKDLNGGGDIARWQRQAREEFLPALLSGPAFDDVDDDGLMDVVFDLAFPVFLDRNPLPTAQCTGPDAKVRFAGKADMATVFVSQDTLFIQSHRGTLHFPLSHILEVNELKFKFSLLSMTSAGPGFEIITRHQRVLFRLAVDVEWELYVTVMTNRLLGRQIPLFDGVDACGWVEPGSSADPKDESGAERHAPYVPLDL